MWQQVSVRRADLGEQVAVARFGSAASPLCQPVPPRPVHKFVHKARLNSCGRFAGSACGQSRNDRLGRACGQKLHPYAKNLRHDQHMSRDSAQLAGSSDNQGEADTSILPTLLGMEFISYCTNTGKAELTDFFSGNSDLPSRAREALSNLADICSEILRYSVEHNTPVHFLWDIFGVRQNGQTSALANSIRLNAGGEVFAPTTRDDLLRELQAAAVDLYPLFLIPPSGQSPIERISASRSLLSYPSAENLVNLVQADVDLRNLYPKRDAGGEAIESNRAARILMSHAPDLVEAIINYAYHNAALRLLRAPSSEEYCVEILQAFRVARSMAKGHRVALPVSIGLANLKLPEGTIIESAAGRLIPYSQIYDRLAPMRARQYKVNLHSDQGEHQFYGVGDIICHALVKFKLDIQSHPGGVRGWQLKEVVNEDLESRQAAICLAATLGVRHELPIAVNPVWMTVLSPISTPILGLWRNDYTLQRAMAPLRVLSIEQAKDWQEWISRISKCGLGTVTIAARRLQSAIAERTGPVDRFVDSVMIWENMFGSGGDVSLRIAASLACFLGESQVDRANLYETVNTLYRLRSQVVHGSVQLSDGEAAVSAEKALDIAIRGLRVLYELHPEMISTSARDRSLCTMLQADIDSLRAAQKAQKK